MVSSKVSLGSMLLMVRSSLKLVAPRTFRLPSTYRLPLIPALSSTYRSLPENTKPVKEILSAVEPSRPIVRLLLTAI